MEFICSNHRRKYLSLPDNELIYFCLHWMQLSETPYTERNWQQALPYIGSAYDLASMLVERDHTLGLHQQLLALSAIYLSNIFHHMGREEEADTILLYTHSQLGNTSTSLDCWQAELLNENVHSELLENHLNVKLLARDYSHHAVH